MNRELTAQEESLLELLGIAKNILENHSIEFWLEGGTLLGAMRSGTFIPWERDIDFGIWSEKISLEKRKLIADDFISLGFHVIRYEDWMHINKDPNYWIDFDFYQYKNGRAVYPAYHSNNLINRFLFRSASILLCPYYYIGELKGKSITKRVTLFLLYYVSRLIPKYLRDKIARFLLKIYKSFGVQYLPRIAPSMYFEKLSKIKFYNLEFNIPQKPKDYLTYKYGEDWLTPKKNWVAERDDGMVNKF